MKIFMTSTTLLKRLKLGDNMPSSIQMKVNNYKVLMVTGLKLRKLKN
jgi:hypothetical protein